MFIANKILFHDALDWIHINWNLLILLLSQQVPQKKKKNGQLKWRLTAARSRRTQGQEERQKVMYIYIRKVSFSNIYIYTILSKNSRSKCTGIVHFYTFTRSSNHTKLLSRWRVFLREKRNDTWCGRAPVGVETYIKQTFF